MSRFFLNPSVVRVVSTLLLAQAALAGPVLNNDASLMTVTHMTRTARQDCLPLWWNRGADLEGGIRFGGDVPASPGFSSGMGAATMGGIELASLGFAMSEVDMALPTNGPAVVIGRSFNHRQGADTSVAASNGLQGYNWFQTAMPEVELWTGGGSNADDVLYLVYGANRFMEFKRTALNATTFKGINGTTGVVSYAAGNGTTTYDTYTITDQNGWSWVFWGGNTAGNKADWQLWTKSDPQGLTVYAGDKSTHTTAVSNGYASGGGISTLYQEFGDPSSPTERRYLFTYTTVASVDRLTQVSAQTKSGGTWGSPSGLTEIGRVSYAYYSASTTKTGDAHDFFGLGGDLKTVNARTALTDSGTGSGTDLSSGIYDDRTKYYRYYGEAYDNSDNRRGHPHALKLVLGFEGARRYDWGDNSTFDTSYDGAAVATTDLKEYSDAFYEYDSSSSTQRLATAFFNGECGCGSGANGTYSFASSANGSYTDNTAAYDTAWRVRTLVTQPDSTYQVRYFDELGQPLSTVVTTNTGGSTHWVTGVDRDSNGRVGVMTTGAISTVVQKEDWQTGGALKLDQVGNWIDYARTRESAAQDAWTANTFSDINVYKTIVGKDGANDLEPVLDKKGMPVQDDVKGGGETKQLGYIYTFDAWDRLRTVKSDATGSGSPTLVEEFRYNGLGHRIAWHYDYDADLDVDGSDPWVHFQYNERWQQMAMYIGTATSPDEVFTYMAAGKDGYGGSSYIDEVVMRERGAERYYYLQNWRHDVVAIMDFDGAIKEKIIYDAYGRPSSFSPGDIKTSGGVARPDGIMDSNDTAAWSTGSVAWNKDIGNSADLPIPDGVVDTHDYNTLKNLEGTFTGGWDLLGDSSVGNRKGYAGYEFDNILQGTGGQDTKPVYHVRHRVLAADTGKWLQKDPLGYHDSMDLYEYCGSDAIARTDPDGRLWAIRMDHKPAVCAKRHEVRWRFGLHHTYEERGWLVQEVYWVKTARECDGIDIATSDHYWEFWRVEADNSRITPEFRQEPDQEVPDRRPLRDGNFHDLWSTRCAPPIGEKVSWTELRFYTDSQIAVHVDNGAEPWGRNPNPSSGAGSLKSTRNRPLFWDSGPREGPGYGLESVVWKCCFGQNDAYGQASYSIELSKEPIQTPAR